jgi:hypothetical protein
MQKKNQNEQHFFEATDNVKSDDQISILTKSYLPRWPLKRLINLHSNFFLFLSNIDFSGLAQALKGECKCK